MCKASTEEMHGPKICGSSEFQANKTKTKVMTTMAMAMAMAMRVHGNGSGHVHLPVERNVSTVDANSARILAATKTSSSS